MTGSGNFGPEDWVASATPRFGRDTDGLTVMPDGRFLRDVIEADPKGWLGPDHVEYFGSDPALLVKLLDAGQRLPVHVHPDRSFAVRHLGSRHGKTEAWVVLGTTGSEPVVYVGWKRDVDQAELSRLVAQQDAATLLALLNKLTVETGDAVLVPAGTAHAIGAKVFCLELQEPTDFSIMLEVAGFDIDPASAYLGLDRELALSCVSSRALRDQDLGRVALQAGRQGANETAAVAPRDGVARDGVAENGSIEDILPKEAAPYFRAQRARGGNKASLEPSFAVVVVDAGAGAMRGDGWQVEAKRGDTFVVPWGAGETKVLGPVELLRCLPPRPVEAAKDDPGATEIPKSGG